uniref:Transmembrane protein 69 n=1 Tax=Clastoptera arizonana TaxID=38151 RepID=A0A1B6D1N0_9HEMI
MLALFKPSSLKCCQNRLSTFSVKSNSYFSSLNNNKEQTTNIKNSALLSYNQLLSSKYLISTKINPQLQQISNLSLSTNRVSESFKKGITVFKDVDLKSLPKAPTSTLLFGLGGVIPFVAAPLSFLFFGYNASIAFAQLAYGASILAFVGGVKWGYAIGKDKPTIQDIGLSTVPSLIAWTGLLVPQSLGILVISSGLGAAFYIDMITSQYPSWFRALRCLLSSTAVISLLTTFLCSF